MPRISLVEGDMFRADLSDADIVYCFSHLSHRGGATGFHMEGGGGDEERRAVAHN